MAVSKLLVFLKCYQVLTENAVQKLQIDQLDFFIHLLWLANLFCPLIFTGYNKSLTTIILSGLEKRPLNYL